MTKAPSSWRAGRLAPAGIAAAVLFAAVFSSSGSASAAGKRKVGVDVNGSPSGPIRAAVVSVLKKHGFAAGSADLSGDSEGAIAAAAKKGHLAAVVVGEVKDGGKRAKLRVYGAGGDLIGEGSWSEKGGAKKLAKAIQRTMWARVGGALAKTKPPAGAEKAEKPEKAEPVEKTPPPSEEESEGETEEEEEKEKPATSRRSEESEEKREGQEEAAAKNKKKRAAAAEEGGGGGAPGVGPALDLGVGGRFFSRSLKWGNNQQRNYTMGYAPALGVSAAWYPAAHFTTGFATNIGLFVSAELAPGLQSKTSDNTKFPTQENDYGVGARVRLALGPVVGAVTVGGGQHAFVIRSSGTANRSMLADLPDVAYTYVRGGADFAIGLPANLSLYLGGGYRYVIDPGKTGYMIGNTFKGVKVTGFDVGGGLGYRILPWLEGRAGGDLRSYQIATHAAAAEPQVRTATDQTVAFWVQLAVILDAHGGKGGSARRAAASEDDDDDEKEEAKPAKPGKKEKEEEPD